MLRALCRSSVLPHSLRRFSDVKRPKRFSVDRSILNANLGIDNSPPIPKELLSPLGKDLKSYIKVKGPISLHDYMAQCLNHLMHGYYQSTGEVIGQGGDFITAPEVSQLFGEMIGIWCISMWEKIGRPSKMNLIELGPGKGTLMNDILKVTNKFTPFKAATSVHMVELSIPLRRQQFERLECTGVTDFRTGEDAPIFDKNGKVQGSAPTGIVDSQGYKNKDGILVHWHSFLYQIPTDAPVLIIGQEFLDAFPVHQFTYTSSGWRERLVDVNGKASGEIKPPVKPHVSAGNPRIEHAKAAVLARMAAKDSTTDPTTDPKPDPSDAVIPDNEENNGFDQKKMDEEAAGFHFRLVLSNAETPAVRLLLTGSEDRLRRDALEQAVFGQGKDAELKPINPADLPPPRKVVKPKVGEGIEVCPLAIATCEDIASRVVKAGGAALLFDYGEDHAQSDSLRAFQKHTQVSFLSQPGLVDVTADVDFSLCRRSAERKGARVPPLLSQGEFLMRMGVADRVQQLLDSDDTSDEQAEHLFSSFNYLVAPEHMGQKFKVLCIASPQLPPIDAFEPPPQTV